MKNAGKVSIAIILNLICVLLFGQQTAAQENQFQFEKQLSKELKEISGTAKDGNSLWAIVDTKNSNFYKLDFSGSLIQTIHINNYKLKDVEAVAVDNKYLYIGDIGDNNGTRKDRTIIKILKSSIGNETTANVDGEFIQFTFPGEGHVKKKKSNDYDCEAMVSFNDSLFVFTKRREDMKTELYALPKSIGNYSARSMGVFKTKGLVTDAAVNDEQNEIALVGYDEGHLRPFVWVFSNFKGNNFFSGNYKRFELSNEKKLDWQVESIAYKDDNDLFIACEKSKDEPNTLYVINKDEFLKSNKGHSK
jgi:hypothetical protein